MREVSISFIGGISLGDGSVQIREFAEAQWERPGYNPGEGWGGWSTAGLECSSGLQAGMSLCLCDTGLPEHQHRLPSEVSPSWTALSRDATWGMLML
jgi:hypothetical protein